MTRLLALLFVLPIYLPIVNQCVAYYWAPAEVSARCPVVEEPQVCTALCDGMFCWPPCDVFPGMRAAR